MMHMHLSWYKGLGLALVIDIAWLAEEAVVHKHIAHATALHVLLARRAL